MSSVAPDPPATQAPEQIVDRQGPRSGRRGAAAREAAARRPADVRGLLDLRVRGRQHRLADRDHRLRLDPRAEGARRGGTTRASGTSSTASTCGRWSCSSSRWSCTCGASTGWPPGAEGARACGSPARSRSSWRSLRAHRLRLPAELRRAVDLHAGQGRDELGRRRRVLQPHQLRPDVQLPRAAAADRGRGARGRPRAARAPARRRAAVRARAAKAALAAAAPDAGARADAPAGAGTPTGRQS